ncbi:MAG: T9SS C-terminal target domain-containing protein [Ignavibacteriae bacterium]|nr:MAG: T9SS C-terminal target domain-containing protein [Ignavibacteriota bacterium]
MRTTIFISKCFTAAFFIFISLIPEVYSQSNNNVISYCYQPLVSGIKQIYCINADGTNNRKIIDGPVSLNHQDWSPDTMKYAAVGYIGSGNTTWSIFTFNYDGTGLTRLTFVNNVWDTDPVWSPDMSRISFTRKYPNQNMRDELWIMNSDGSNQHYTGIEGFMAKWSRNGMKFIYTSKRINNRYDIFTCDTNGTNEQRLTNTAADERFPVYSPDGSEIVFSAGTGSSMTDWEIYKMKSDGTDVRQLTSNGAYEFCVQWSPDGTMFAYGSDIHEAGKWEIYTMDTSGANTQRITYSPVNITAINPVWRRPLPNKVENINSTVPGNYKLYQNYPNPFNPKTIINYQLPMSNYVKLVIYDVMGKETAVLVNQKHNAGTYEVEWIASEYPSGIYFYTMETDNFKSTKKMILLK